MYQLYFSRNLCQQIWHWKLTVQIAQLVGHWFSTTASYVQSPVWGGYSCTEWFILGLWYMSRFSLSVMNMFPMKTEHQSSCTARVIITVQWTSTHTCSCKLTYTHSYILENKTKNIVVLPYFMFTLLGIGLWHRRQDSPQWLVEGTGQNKHHAPQPKLHLAMPVKSEL